MSEHDEQCVFFDWVLRASGAYPDLCLLHAIPNGEARPWKVSRKGKRYSPAAQRLVMEGVRRGVPDIHLPVSRGPYIGLWIEMKFGKNTLTDDQAWWLEELKKQRHYTAVCHSAEEAIAVTINYLTLKG